MDSSGATHVLRPASVDGIWRRPTPSGGRRNAPSPVSATQLQQAYFDQITVRKLPPATVATGKPNLWPDPGFESVLGQGGGVSTAGTVTIAPGVREGLHVLNLAAGATYARQVTGLVPAKRYLFSVWKDPGTGWVRELRPALAPDSGGNLTITLNQAATYDQAELVEDPGTAVESWIPENRLGRVDWFLTDHLGSTKLLVSQDGSSRYMGDDDPFGINLRSLGEKDSHRYTGQILDEDQGIYYYGARLYDSELGRFLSGDPKQEFASLYIYVGNLPTSNVDPDGEEVHLYSEALSANVIGGGTSLLSFMKGAVVTSLWTARHSWLEVTTPKGSWSIELGAPRDGYGRLFIEPIVAPIRRPRQLEGQVWRPKNSVEGDYTFENRIIEIHKLMYNEVFSLNDSDPIKPHYNPFGPNSNGYVRFLAEAAGGGITFPHLGNSFGMSCGEPQAIYFDKETLPYWQAYKAVLQKHLNTELTVPADPLKQGSPMIPTQAIGRTGAEELARIEGESNASK